MNSKSSNVALAIYKVVAVFMVVGSIGGILSNCRHLIRYGMTQNSSGYAIAGCVASILIFLACIHILRMSLLKNIGPT